MFRRHNTVAFIMAMILLGIPNVNATASMGGNTGRASTAAGTASSRDLEGKITQIDPEKIIIDGASFSYEWKVNPDFAPIALENFSPGDHVFFQVNKQGRITKIVSATSPQEPTTPSANGSSEKSGPRPANNTPARSAPVKKQNGVWTN